MRKPLPEKEPVKGFNLQVTYRDEITGRVTHTDPYTLRIVGESGSNEKARYFERPKNSGNLFNSKNEPVGRWIYEEKIVKGKAIKVGRYDATAEHVAYVPPLTADQKLRAEMTADKVRLAELERELQSIKAEKEKKTAPAKAETKG